MWLVMVTVPALAPAVHDIFMARPRHPFHDEDGADHNEDDADNAHIVPIIRKWRNIEVQRLSPHLISLQSVLWHFYYVHTANTVRKNLERPCRRTTRRWYVPDLH